MSKMRSRRQTQEFRPLATVLGLSEIVEANDMNADVASLSYGQTWEHLLDQVINDAAQNAFCTVQLGKHSKHFNKAKWIEEQIIGHKLLQGKWSGDLKKITKESLTALFDAAVKKIECDEALDQGENYVESEGYNSNHMQFTSSTTGNSFGSGWSDESYDTMDETITVGPTQPNNDTMSSTEAQQVSVEMATRFKTGMPNTGAGDYGAPVQQGSSYMTDHDAPDNAANASDANSVSPETSFTMTVPVFWMDDDGEYMLHLNGAVNITLADNTVQSLKTLVEEDLYSEKPYEIFGIIGDTELTTPMILHTDARCKSWHDSACSSRRNNLVIFNANSGYPWGFYLGKLLSSSS